MPDRRGGVTLSFVNGVQTGVWDSTSSISTYGRWFTYPHNAGTNDMKVHLQVRRATLKDKITLHNFFERGHDKDYFYNHLDFFTAEAHLETPTGGGNAVQPTGAVNTQATWTGKVIAIDTARQFDHTSGRGNFWRRGDVIGGTATVNLFFSNLVTIAGVRLTNLKGSTVGTSYPDIELGGGNVSNGSFSNTSALNSDDFPGAKVSGTFRGTGAAKVGGTFEIPNHYRWQSGRWVGMVGGFIADKQ